MAQFNSLGLFERTFPGININTTFEAEIRHPLIAIANLMKFNPLEKIQKVLKEGKWSADEIEAVSFLIKLSNKLKEFDKLSFHPLIDGKWLQILVKERDLVFMHGVIGVHELIQWGMLENINKHLLDVFRDFTINHGAKDFPGVPPGPELGKMITQAIGNEFLKRL